MARDLIQERRERTRLARYRMNAQKRGEITMFLE